MCARVRVRACSRAGADYRGGKAEYREIPPMDSYLFITHLSSRALCRLQRGHSAAAQAPAPPPSLSVQDYSGGVGQRFKAIPPPLPSPFSPPRSAEYSGGGLRFEAFQVPRPPPGTVARTSIASWVRTLTVAALRGLSGAAPARAGPPAATRSRPALGRCRTPGRPTRGDGHGPPGVPWPGVLGGVPDRWAGAGRGCGPRCGLNARFLRGGNRGVIGAKDWAGAGRGCGPRCSVNARGVQRQVSV